MTPPTKAVTALHVPHAPIRVTADGDHLFFRIFKYGNSDQNLTCTNNQSYTEGSFVLFVNVTVHEHLSVSQLGLDGLYGGTLVQRALLGSWSDQQTTTPKFSETASAQVRQRPKDVVASSALSTAAQDAVREIKKLSGLTNEEIAPLVGVSRRSLQAWLAGETISARKDRRLRALIDAIRKISPGNASLTRRRLFDRAYGNVRPYDLLVEEHFAEAVDVILGRRTKGQDRVQSTALYGLEIQLNHNEARVDLPKRGNNLRLSGPLKR